MEATEHNEALRKRSGRIDSIEPVVSFLYELMRDHLPAGTVERIVRNSLGADRTTFTNGYLAKYAEDLADRLREE
jgi:hypothetical protein